ncbi:hypothetical protein B0H14DRAFT_2647989 [Mycena olivaceomarginata]|nr:hypothetical protein B0H14DRAFT_2647989 [Mycena olivaceomarginata]
MPELGGDSAATAERQDGIDVNRLRVLKAAVELEQASPATQADGLSTSLDASGFEIVWPSGWVEAEVAALSDTESGKALGEALSVPGIQENKWGENMWPVLAKTQRCCTLRGNSDGI